MIRLYHYFDTSVTLVQQKCNTSVTILSQKCYTTVTLVLESCNTSVTVVSQHRNTAFAFTCSSYMSTVFKVRFIPNEVCQLSWHGLTSSPGVNKRRKFQKINLERVTWSVLIMKLMRRTKVSIEEENNKHKKMAYTGFRRGNLIKCNQTQTAMGRIWKRLVNCQIFSLTLVTY